MSKHPLKVLSLGAGVQSTVVYLMSCLGEIERVDCAIFADTGWEPKSVYEHLAWLEANFKIHIHRVTKGDIRKDSLRATVRDPNNKVQLPFFSTNGTSVGQIRRQCSGHYKIEPVRKKIRSLIDKIYTGCVELWMGISWDERKRMSMSRVKYITHYYPLIDQEMTRYDCLKWMSDHGFPEPPRSACLGCPYHSNADWRLIKQNPDEWTDVVEFDRAIRRRGGDRGDLYLHRSCQPLEEIDFRSLEDLGQESLFRCEACFN